MIEIAEDATVMLQGPGQRFDFHMSKTLCDLRYCLSLGGSSLLLSNVNFMR